jgi:hypothetical protein
VTPKVDGYVPCVCCNTPVLVFASRSYLPGPICRPCKKMCDEIDRADAARDQALYAQMQERAESRAHETLAWERRS